MTNAQIIAAIVAALQVQDANGEYSNVILVMQALIINNLENGNVSQMQLQNVCNVLGINTSGS